MEPLPLLVNILTLIWPITSTIKERHFVLRNSAAANGILITITGIALIPQVINQNLISLFGLPLYVFLIFYGLLSTLVVLSNSKIGLVLGRGITTVLILGFSLLLQIGFF